MATSTIKGTATETINLTVSSLSHLLRVDNAKIYRKGNVGLLTFNAYNTASDLAAGNDASFAVSGMPSLVAPVKITGYSGATAMICSVGQSTIYMRVTGGTWLKNYNCVCEGIVLFE